MLEAFYQFLLTIFPESKVSLAYSDKITGPGLSCIFYETSTDTEKNLEGTTFLVIYNYTVEIWEDSIEAVERECKKLFTAAEETKFQVQSFSIIWQDQIKRKWHREIEFQIMEEPKW